MASPRQLAANRANGAKGGPKTEAGKQRSRLSSLKHGLTASTLVVLPEENEHEYEEILRGFRESFQPHDPAEDALVLRLAHAHWRSLRSRRVETGILSVTSKVQRNRARKLVENCPENLNPHEAIAVGFMTMPAEHWQMYLRYDTTISREFFKTLDALTKLQRARQLKKPAPPPVPEPPPALALAAGAGITQTASSTAKLTADSCELIASSQLSDCGIGSVSQNSQIRPSRGRLTQAYRQSGSALPNLNEQKQLTQSGANTLFAASPIPATPAFRQTPPIQGYALQRSPIPVANSL